LPDWIEPTVDYLRQKAVLSGACAERRSGKLMVTLHEAITNAMIHGNLEVGSELKEQGDDAFAFALAQRAAHPDYANRKIDIVIDFDGETCRWVITDEGPGFDVEGVLARCLSDDPEILLRSGRGILMMKSFLDDVSYALGGRRVVLALARNSGLERRKDTRVPLSAPFQVTPISTDGLPDWSNAYEAVSRNLSETGMSLLQQQIAATGKVLIGVATEHGVVHIPADVKHSRPLGASGMELGCQFTQASVHAPPNTAGESPQLDEVHEAIVSILDAYQAQQLPTDERRVHPRVVFNERVSVFVSGRHRPIIGYARDLSKGGMAIIAQEPLPPEVSIEFTDLANRPGFKVRCKVVRCSLILEGFYDIGMTFLRMG
jgi:anti-sigma regulatory factor (Ser/Thr protein kinase)/c-di-GMP-binding flagellar brake protein YcgR